MKVRMEVYKELQDVQRTIGCTKDNEGCKNFNEGFGDNINKVAKEFCESDSGQKCKRSKE